MTICGFFICSGQSGQPHDTFHGANLPGRRRNPIVDQDRFLGLPTETKIYFLLRARPLVAQLNSGERIPHRHRTKRAGAKLRPGFGSPV